MDVSTMMAIDVTPGLQLKYQQSLNAQPVLSRLERESEFNPRIFSCYSSNLRAQNSDSVKLE